MSTECEAQRRTASFDDADGPPLPASAPILLVDVHELVGWSLTHCLRDAGEPASFCPARSLQQIPDLTRPGGPGLLVLELRLGCDGDGHPIDGPGLVAAMVARGWRAVVLTGTAAPEEVGAAPDAGAVGWMPKTRPFPALLATLRAARAGRRITAADQRCELVGRARRRTHERGRHRAALYRLTPRELDVLADLADGRRPPAIAARHAVSPHTVATQIRAVLTKLDVRSQLEAVALYHEAATRPDAWDRPPGG